MDISTIVNIVLCIFSFLLAVISVVTVVITLRQNHKMIENSTRPYIVIYNDLVDVTVPIQFLVIRNFGQTAAKIETVDITPKVDFTYSDDLFGRMKNQTIAPGQSYSTAFTVDNSVTLTAKVIYLAGKKRYEETYTISQKAISDHVHSKISSVDESRSLAIIANCFQDYLRLKL